MKSHPTILRIAAAIALAGALGACSKERPIDGGEGEPVTILLDVATRGAGTPWQGGGEEDAIESMRVLVYETASGELKWNRLATGEPPHRIDMTAGVYDFVFVANEGSDDGAGGLAAALADEADYNAMDELRALTVHRAAFGAGRALPMAAHYRSVSVEVGGAVAYTDPFDGTARTEAGGRWPVRVEHVGVCVSMSVVLTDEQYNSWALSGENAGRIGIAGIPDRAHLLPGIDNGAYRSAETEWFAATAAPDWDAPDPEQPSTEGRTVYCRAVLPELVFTPNTDESRALVLTMDVDGERSAKIVAHEDEAFGHTLPRNTWLHLRGVTVEISDPGTPPEPPAGTANARITWDEASGTYTLTTDPTDAGLYFKFGGVTGVYSGNHANQTLPATNTDPFDPADVAWSPVTTITGTGAAGWATVPSYTAADYNLSPNTVTAPVYHNAANVKAGRGDPCRLVGLDLGYIAATDAGSLTDADIDNGRWRLPTNAEWQAFTGQTANADGYTAHWTALSGVAGGIFPDRTSGGAATFLPAAGYRTTAGAVSLQSTRGNYWGGMPYSSSNGHYMSLGNDRVYPHHNNVYAYGFAVRCVRQETQPQQQPGEPPLDTENARVTWDADRGRYALAANMTDAGLYFMFGSVVGVYSGDGEVSALPMGENDDEFDAGDIAWNPTGVTGSGAASWLSIPRFNDTNTDLANYPSGSHIDAGYHTAANVKAGKGDPCRLVGLDLDHIAATDASALTFADIDNGRWRMPTRAENIAFSGQQYHTSTSIHWMVWPDGVAGGVFPSVDTGTDATTLPATGYRTAQDGAVNDQDTNGFYWSSEVGSNTDALSMRFDNSMICANEYNNAYRGMSVRCVRQ